MQLKIVTVCLVNHFEFALTTEKLVIEHITSHIHRLPSKNLALSTSFPAFCNKKIMEDKKYITLGIGLGVALGTSLGTTIGVLTDNLGLWMGMGISMGVGIGLAIGAALQHQYDQEKVKEEI